METYRGSCHCGRVQFEADIDLGQSSYRCNCSICRRTRFWPAVVKSEDLPSGEAELTQYLFNTRKNHHYFCRHCGVRAFGIGNGTPVAHLGIEFLEVGDDSSARVRRWTPDDQHTQPKELSMPTEPTRRDLLSHSMRLALLLASVGMLPALAQAQASGYNTAAFEARSIAELMKALGADTPVESKELTITGPDIAENGAVVPVAVATALPGVKRMLILVEKNPAVMSAMFDVSDAIDSNFSTRVKMGQSSNVYAVAMMGDGKVLFAQKDIKVTLGGCGG